MRLTPLPVMILLLTACLTAGCGSEAESTKTVIETPADAELPAGLFVASPPESPIALITAKTEAKIGDRIVFEARIGGRREPFVKSRAVFFVADSSLLSCDQLHGDSCRTPWDYCCEGKDSLLRHLATVQVVDDIGRPLRLSLESRNGLEPLRTVLVTGTVAQTDPSGLFVVNAESIHVKEG